MSWQTYFFPLLSTKAVPYVGYSNRITMWSPILQSVTKTYTRAETEKGRSTFWGWYQQDSLNVSGSSGIVVLNSPHHQRLGRGDAQVQLELHTHECRQYLWQSGSWGEGRRCVPHHQWESLLWWVLFCPPVANEKKGIVVCRREEKREYQLKPVSLIIKYRLL